MAGFGLQHYLNNFIAIFPAVEIPPERMNYEAKAYIWLTDIHGIPRNDSKDQMGTELSVFGIKVNTSIFTARLPKDKLERAIKSTAEVLANSSRSNNFSSIATISVLVIFVGRVPQAFTVVTHSSPVLDQDQDKGNCSPATAPCSLHLQLIQKPSSLPSKFETLSLDPKRPLLPLIGKIKSCGPTVYDDAHLVPARNYVSTDILRRILRDSFKFNIQFVMDKTDVDDKVF
ncbi:hypothetical protein MMC31_001381 [Peltigera leucophlebia]|nr:hypothetical protein [Peltigera leucophlebia]